MPSTSVNFDLLARDRASGTFQKFGSTADKTSSKLSKLGKIAKVGLFALGGAAAGGAAGLAVLTKGAIDDDAAQKRLAKTLKNTTGATKSQVAGVEDWITAQGKALGVTDDSLRPALDKLAVATGSVSKSQKLAALAMDVSAGTGKDLGAVSAALAKGYNGNVGGLSRLGVATKDAEGKTKSFAQIQADLAKKFSGQSQTAANTLSGKLGRLKLILSETGESIGYKVLPMVTRLATWFLNKGVPAISQFGSFLDQKISPVLERIRTVIGTQVVPAISTFVSQLQNGQGVGGRVAAAFQTVATTLGTLFNWISSNKATVGTFVGIIGTAVAISKVWTVTQIALNAVLMANPLSLIVVGLAGLAAGLVYAYKHSEKFRSVVQAAFAAVKSSAAAVAGFFTSTVPAAFNKVKSAAASALNWVKGHWPLLLGIITGPIGLAVGLVVQHWNSISSAARSALNKVIGFFKGLPGRIKGAVGDLSGLLSDVGHKIIDGLLKPLREGADKVKGVLKGITDKIPDWKGPPNKDKVLLTPAGIAIMEGLLAGMKKKWSPVKSFLQSVTDNVKATGDRLKELISTRDDFAAGFQSFASSIFGRDPGTDADGNPIAESVSGIKAFAASQAADAAKLAANIKRLIGLGLSKDLIAQMSQGPAGNAQINALASGASRADIAYLNNQNKATAASLNAAGMSAANAIYGGDIAQARRDKAAADAFERAVERAMGKTLDGAKLHADIDGDKLILVINRTRKKKGKGPI